MLRFARLLLVLTALTQVGCGFGYHFVDKSAVPAENHSMWASYYLWGIVGHYEIDVRELCPKGVREIETGNNFPTWLLKIITFGIYAPRTIDIRCSGGREAAFGLPESSAQARVEVRP